MRKKPCRIGVSGLLVINNLIRTLRSSPSRGKSCNKVPILLWSSHSSRASITHTNTLDARRFLYRDKGCSTNFAHWSCSDCASILVPSRDSRTWRRMSSALHSASCRATLVTKMPAWLESPPPLEKKKLAARRRCSLNSCAMVRAIADLPVPGHPLNQNMQLLSSPSTHWRIF
jgi:hypothetical protein